MQTRLPCGSFSLSSRALGRLGALGAPGARAGGAWGISGGISSSPKTGRANHGGCFKEKTHPNVYKFPKYRFSINKGSSHLLTMSQKDPSFYRPCLLQPHGAIWSLLNPTCRVSNSTSWAKQCQAITPRYVWDLPHIFSWHDSGSRP